MKIFFILTFAIVCGMTVNAQEQPAQVTTYYLIRHAEKDRSDPNNKDPNLNSDGQKRAELWRNHFKNIKLDAIYATDYKRTAQTAKPTAEAKALATHIYDADDLYSEGFQEASRGKTVLVVGHSNTTPAFANAILGKKMYEDIDDSVNSNLYVITVDGEVHSWSLFTVE